MAVETFELVLGNLVFPTQAICNQAQTAIQNLLNKPTFRDVEPTIYQVPAGKYGAGPSLNVTLRMRDRADADALWAEAASRFGILLAGSFCEQSSITMDQAEGTSSAIVIHMRHFPPFAGDIN